jgi:hypothetical protein
MSGSSDQPAREGDQVSEALGNSSLQWNADIDDMLASWCDKAKCFEWMHTEAYSLFDRRNKQFMISINCLTAVSGLANVIAGGYSVNGFQISWVFGGLSIAVSTLNMLQDKLGYAASSHLHKKMASDWSSIKAKIEEIVSIPYSGRKDCKTLLGMIRSEVSKAAADGNSLIPEDIRDACYEKFKDIADFDIPDICGKLEHTKVYVGDATVVSVKERLLA